MNKIIKLPRRRRIGQLSGDEAFTALKEIERDTATRIRLKLSDHELRELLRTIELGAQRDPEVARAHARWLAGACDFCMRPILGAKNAAVCLGDELLKPKRGLTYLPGIARKFWSISHLSCIPKPWNIYRLDALARVAVDLPWDVRAEIARRRAIIDANGNAAEKEARELPKLRVYDLEAGTLEEFEQR